jgi:hypothetical protein
VTADASSPPAPHGSLLKRRMYAESGLIPLARQTPSALSARPSVASYFPGLYVLPGENGCFCSVSTRRLDIALMHSCKAYRILGSACRKIGTRIPSPVCLISASSRTTRNASSTPALLRPGQRLALFHLRIALISGLLSPCVFSSPLAFSLYPPSSRREWAAENLKRRLTAMSASCYDTEKFK